MSGDRRPKRLAKGLQILLEVRVTTANLFEREKKAPRRPHRHAFVQNSPADPKHRREIVRREKMFIGRTPRVRPAFEAEAADGDARLVRLAWRETPPLMLTPGHEHVGQVEELLAFE